MFSACVNQVNHLHHSSIILENTFSTGWFNSQYAGGTSYCTALFIDNSNLFIEGKKFYAKYLDLLVTQDPCFRIDIGKLCDVLLEGRTLNFGKLYGSEPPSLDTVWRKIREHGLNVSTYQRDSKDKEKELDNALTADATEYVCEMTKKRENGNYSDRGRRSRLLPGRRENSQVRLEGRNGCVLR
jgi:hypothetical protein